MTMKGLIVSLETSVAELLDHWPQAAPVLFKHRMACIGCYMSAFDTLGDIARNYAIDPAQLIREIEQVIEGNNP
jgi:hybrid cluster-associated redox disulfide protein